MEVTSKPRSNSHRGAKTRKRSVKRTKIGIAKKEQRPTDFLTQPISDIPGYKINGLRLSGLNINEARNIAYLIETTKSYCKNHEINFNFISNGNFWDDIHNLYYIIHENLPLGHYLNIDWNKTENQIIFIESAECLFYQNTVFFTPVKCLEQLQGVEREIMLNFFALLYKYTPIQMPSEHFEFAFTIEDAVDSFVEATDEYYLDFAENYRNGKIKQLFNEILDTVSYLNENRFSELLISYNPTSDSKLSENLINTIKAGMELMKTDSINAYRYMLSDCTLSEFCREEQEEDMIDVERLFCFCYDNEDSDPITSNAINFLNEEANNISQEVLMDWKKLEPTDAEPFVESDFPKKWSDWFCEFYRQIEML